LQHLDIMRGSPLTLVLAVSLIVGAAAAMAADSTGVVGTWRGTAEEVVSPHIQGRAQVTVEVMADGRWTSTWRQAGREQRSSGHWRSTDNRLVLETDSAEPLPPRLTLARRGEVAYGTALAPLPEGRTATVTITLTHVAPPPVASRPGL
jgi:hypothetical protein